MIYQALLISKMKQIIIVWWSMNEKNIYLDMELLYKFNYVFGSILALKILDEVHKNAK